MSSEADLSMHSLKLQSSEVEKKQLSFLNLPSELRIQIYHIYLPHNKYYSLSQKEPDNNNQERKLSDDDQYYSLLLVCKKINSEAMDVFYGQNIFNLGINEGGRSWLEPGKFLTQRQLNRMRKAQLVASPYRGFPNVFPTRPIFEFWGPLLSRLTFVSLVIGPAEYWIPPAHDHLMEAWLEKVERVTQVIAEFLPRDSHVEIDHNGCKRTVAVIDKCLAERYHERQTLAGDRIHERGDYECACSWQLFD